MYWGLTTMNWGLTTINWGLTTIYSQFFTLMYGISGIEVSGKAITSYFHYSVTISKQFQRSCGVFHEFVYKVIYQDHIFTFV